MARLTPAPISTLNLLIKKMIIKSGRTRLIDNTLVIVERGQDWGEIKIREPRRTVPQQQQSPSRFGEIEFDGEFLPRNLWGAIVVNGRCVHKSGTVDIGKPLLVMGWAQADRILREYQDAHDADGRAEIEEIRKALRAAKAAGVTVIMPG